jgi:hypothetical protein
MNWIAAEKQIFEDALKAVEKTNQALIRVYLITQKEIEAELKQFYLSVDPSWTKQYQAARLTEVFKTISIRLKALTGISTEKIEQAFLRVYQDTFNNYAYNLSDVYTGFSSVSAGEFVALPFSIQPEATILAALNKKIGSYNFLGQMNENTALMRQQLREAVAVSIQKGEGPRKLAKRLDDIFGSDLSKSIRTARTEMLKAFSLAQDEAMDEAREMGIEFTYIWLGRDDGRERASHVVLNNTYPKSFSTSGKPIFKAGSSSGYGPRLLKGSDSAAQNIQCRCRRLNIPMAIDQSESFPVVNGKPSFRDYIRNLEN